MDAALTTASLPPPGRFAERAGRALARRRPEQVSKLAQGLLAREPASVEARLALASAAWLMHDWAQAAAHASAACEGEEALREAADLAAVCYGLAGDLTSCMYYAKLAAALPARPDLALLLPADLPPLPRILSEIDESALLQRSLRALAINDLGTAEHWLQQYLAFRPECADGHLQLALVVLAQGRIRAAADLLRAARHRLPEDVEIASLLARTLTGYGRFGEASALHAWCMARSPDDAVVAAATLSDLLADPEVDTAVLCREFRSWGGRFGVTGPVPADPGHGSTLDPDKPRLTIGLLVASEAAGAAQRALAEAFVHRDARRFTLVGFGFGSLGGGAGAGFQNAVDLWRDVADADPLTMGAMIRAEGIDVLVDLAGFATPHLLTGLAARLAPCQAAWLNAPYGTGLAAVDFLLTDGFVDPGAEQDAFCSGDYPERLIYLENGCMPQPLIAPAEPPVARPEDGITFAADVTLADLTPGTVACWADVLQRVPDSMLLLRDRDFRDPETMAELIGRLGNFGIAGRVDLAPAQDAAELFREADVALLPFAQPRAETVSAALQAGIPPICPVGPARHRRLAGSVLHHLGLGEGTLPTGPDAYVEAAAGWAASPDRRRDFRVRVRERIKSGADARARSRDLEQAFLRMWRMRAAVRP